MWMICQTTRACGALPKFEEFLWLSATTGNNGKGAWIALLMGILGAQADDYYGKLDFETHFVGGDMAGKNVNNPDVAALEGKRFVSVNEAVPSDSKKPLNVNLIKQLASLDEPLNAMAKHKDPSMWTPQMLLAFFANKSPVFKESDGGIISTVCNP